MKRLALTVFLFMTTSAHADGSPDCSAEALGWMVGQWRHCDASGCTQERWLAGHDGRMLGVNQQWGKHSAFEFLRIESRDDSVVYLAQPGGGPATAFVMERCLDHEVHFANAENDFPQRIIYRADGDDTLIARIEGRQQGRDKAMHWRWRRVAADRQSLQTDDGH